MSAAPPALVPMLFHHPLPEKQESRVPKEILGPEVKGDSQAHLEEMASQDSLVSPAPPAPLVPLALEETLLPKCLMAMMRNQVAACLCLDPWVPLVLGVSQVPPAHLVPKVSKAPLVNPASLELQVPWVPEVLQVPLARMEMMVKLANLVAPVNVVLLVLRVLEVCPELLVSLA